MVAGGARAGVWLARGMDRILATALLLNCVLGSSAAGRQPPIIKTDKLEEVEVRWVHYPVLFEPKIENGCQGLGPEMVQITEDGGPPLPVADVSLNRLPTIHAVVIDVSSSRTDLLPVAVAAAAQYAAKTRPQDEVAVLTLGNNLRLVEGFAPARDLARRLQASSERFTASGLTALWDGLDDLLRYLAPRPEHKVVILLTDGCDTASLLPRSPLDRPAAAFSRFAAAEDLSLFSIGLAVPPRCTSRLSGSYDPRTTLALIAAGSGGDNFLVPYQPYPQDWRRKLDRVFDRILSRLEREGSILYRPQPFGQGPKDDPQATRERWREVRVRWKQRRTGRRCRLTPAGPPLRLASRRRDPPDTGLERLLTAEESAPALPAPLRLPLISPWSRLCENDSRLLAGGSCAQAEATFVEVGASGTRGRVLDLLHEQGPLYTIEPAPEGASYTGKIDWEPRLASRDFVLDPPLLERLQRGWNSIDLALMAQSEIAEPSFVQGSTFLQLRSRLGQALMARDDYRSWARRRLYEENRRLDQALWKGVDGDQWEALAPGLDARARMVEPDDPQRVLAAWLGDIDADVLAQRIETRVVGAFLADPGSQDLAAWRARVEHLAHFVRRQWKRWAEWFPIATDQRVVVPLVPVYDRRRDRVGYYRVVLPAPGVRHARHTPPPHRWPDAPLALMLVEELTSRSRIAAAFCGQAVVTGIARRDLSKQDAFQLYLKWKARPAAGKASAFEPIRRARHELTLVVAPSARNPTNPGGREAWAVLRAYYEDSRGSTPPLCLALSPATAKIGLRPWAANLRRTLETEFTLCP